MTVPMLRDCIVCGRPIRYGDRATRRRWYCSQGCGVKAAALRRKKGIDLRMTVFKPYGFRCACCGELVRVETPDDGRTRFCSTECSHRYHSASYRRRAKLERFTSLRRCVYCMNETPRELSPCLELDPANCSNGEPALVVFSGETYEERTDVNFCPFCGRSLS